MRSTINAVLSDYDGTLSPTMTLKSNIESIPKQLEGVLSSLVGNCSKNTLSVLSPVKIIILYVRVGNFFTLSKYGESILYIMYFL
jgi:hypothetical protein